MMIPNTNRSMLKLVSSLLNVRWIDNAEMPRGFPDTEGCLLDEARQSLKIAVRYQGINNIVNTDIVGIC